MQLTFVYNGDRVGLSDEGTGALAAGLRSLRRLNMSWHRNLGDTAAGALAAMTALTHLDLGYCDKVRMGWHTESQVLEYRTLPRGRAAVKCRGVGQAEGRRQAWYRIGARPLLGLHVYFIRNPQHEAPPLSDVNTDFI